MVDLAGQVAKRLQALAEAIAAPGWPEPSSNPMKPLLNGILTVLGLIIGRVITRRAGLDFRPRFKEQSGPAGQASLSRPIRVCLALLGIVIPAVVALVLPLAVYGGGSKTVELVGYIIDMYLKVAVVLVIMAALLERAHDRQTDDHRTVNAERIERNLHIALIVLFLVYSTAVVVAFMYPDEATNELARLASVSVVAMLSASLAARHRADIGYLVQGILGDRFQGVSRSSWLLICGYVVVAWLTACALVLLGRDYALTIVLAPAFGLLVGVSIYHVVAFIAGLVLRPKAPAPLPAPMDGETGTGANTPPGAIENYRMPWARNMAYAIGLITGLLVMLDRFGVSFTEADGSIGFVPTAAIVILFAYAVWTYAREAIDRRIAIETGSASGAESGDGEAGIGLSRLATLLPLLRNVILVTIVFLVCLILLYAIGVDITPIFASAGIVGLAIGFGAQSLVRDVISGLFFLLDDAFRLGEYIEIGKTRGAVERISIRSMQLRHHNGPLNTVPFGGISQVTNYSRDWVIMKLPIKVTLHTDPERVRKLVKKLGQDLLEDPEVGDKFIEPLKSQGVLAIDNWGMTMRVKFKTLPGNQFIVRRYVYAKLHDMFEREGIEFASRDLKVMMESPGAQSEGNAGPEAKAGPGAAVAAGSAMAVAAIMADDDAGPQDDGIDNDAR